MTKKDTSYPQLSAVGHWGPYQMPAFRPPVVNPKSKEHNNGIFKAKLHLSIFARWHNHIPSASDELQALPGQERCIESSPEEMALSNVNKGTLWSSNACLCLESKKHGEPKSGKIPFSQESERNITELCATISWRAAARYEKEYYRMITHAKANPRSQPLPTTTSASSNRNNSNRNNSNNNHKYNNDTTYDKANNNNGNNKNHKHQEHTHTHTNKHRVLPSKSNQILTVS